MVHAGSLTSKVAPQEPAVSVGAGEFVARVFTSPKSFFQNQADHGKDYNVGMGARSLNWHARRNENCAAPETSFFDENAAAPETRACPTTERPIQISAIGGHPFRRWAYKQKLTIFSTFLYEINQALGLSEQAKKPKELDLKTYIPAEYHEFLPLFSEALAKNLPPHQLYDHKIPFARGFHASFWPAILDV